MKQLVTAVVVFCLYSWAGAQSPGIKVDVTLNPVGDFVAETSSLKGFVVKNGEVIEGKDLRVDLRTLKTKIKLRDEHAQKYLGVDKHPEAIVSIAKGKAGKGKAKLQLNGVEKVVEGSYKIVSDKFVEAEFALKLSDFKIEGISYKGIGVEDEVRVRAIVPIKN